MWKKSLCAFIVIILVNLRFVGDSFHIEIGSISSDKRDGLVQPGAITDDARLKREEPYSSRVNNNKRLGNSDGPSYCGTSLGLGNWTAAVGMWEWFSLLEDGNTVIRIIIAVDFTFFVVICILFVIAQVLLVMVIFLCVERLCGEKCGNGELEGNLEDEIMNIDFISCMV